MEGNVVMNKVHNFKGEYFSPISELLLFYNENDSDSKSE
jgi:hypothetical protein